jgi:hypothetical protein
MKAKQFFTKELLTKIKDKTSIDATEMDLIDVKSVMDKNNYKNGDDYQVHITFSFMYAIMSRFER